MFSHLRGNKLNTRCLTSRASRRSLFVDFKHHLREFRVIISSLFEARAAGWRSACRAFVRQRARIWNRVRLKVQNFLRTLSELFGERAFSRDVWNTADCHPCRGCSRFEAVLATQRRYRCLLAAREIHRLVHRSQQARMVIRILDQKWWHVICSTSECSNFINMHKIFALRYLTWSLWRKRELARREWRHPSCRRVTKL